MTVKRPLQTIFFGTYDFAATILIGLLKSPLFSITHVVTQPDRPVGRKQIVEPSPVKVVALNAHIPVHQPETLKQFSVPGGPYDLGITAQYGGLIPQSILELPTYGMINVHTSLLPKYRGASPIQAALIHGDTETGVTIMRMDVGLDTGPILLQKRLHINPNDTYPILDQKLAPLALEALLEAIPPYIEGTLIPSPQHDAGATVCKKLSREDGRINWNESATAIYNLYRGLYPWPGVWTMWNGKRMKLLSLEPSDASYTPGSLHIDDGILVVGCGNGSLRIHELQIEGKNAQSAAAFIHGYPALLQSHFE
ncbi:MAG TPA: methionyl-tRNA formyltransferase [Candidatus Kapabacteria bacterium]|nr:methionyl-tRNA formyltransferase [Candidatus Kapabacteria bacterium]